MSGIGIGISEVFTRIGGTGVGGACAGAEFPLVDDNVDRLLDDNGDCIINGLTEGVLMDSNSVNLQDAAIEYLLEN